MNQLFGPLSFNEEELNKIEQEYYKSKANLQLLYASLYGTYRDSEYAEYEMKMETKGAKAEKPTETKIGFLVEADKDYSNMFLDVQLKKAAYKAALRGYKIYLKQLHRCQSEE